MIVHLSSFYYHSFVPKPAKLIPPPLPETLPPIGTQIANLRKSHGFSQDVLAEKIGITRKQVSDYENRRAHLNDEMVIRFSLALGVSSDEILGLKKIDIPDESLGLRFTRRIRDLDQLSEPKKKAILKTLDDLIRANS